MKKEFMSSQEAIKFDYTVKTKKPFTEAVVAVRRATEGKGWSILHVHDIRETLATKGFEQEPLKVVEICKGKYANTFLNADRLISLCMPCRISVYKKSRDVFISGMRPVLLPMLFPEAGLNALAEQVDTELRGIVDTAQ